MFYKRKLILLLFIFLFIFLFHFFMSIAWFFIWKSYYKESLFDSFMMSITIFVSPLVFIFYLILIMIYFLNIPIKNICLKLTLNKTNKNIIIYKKEHFYFDKMNILFFDCLKFNKFEFISFLNNFLNNLNQQNLIAKKTNKSEEKIKEIILQKNSFDFDFNKYFIFVESNKLKEIKQENLIKEFEEKIFNKGIKLNDFGKKIKIENKKTKEKNKKTKEKRLEEILNEDDLTLKTSNSNQIDLENSIKEIKN